MCRVHSPFFAIRGVTRVTRIASARFRSGLVGRDSNDARVYQQTFIHTYAKVAFAKPYDRKTPITAAEILNNRVVPFYGPRRAAQGTTRAFRRCSIFWEAYGRGILKISWGTSQFVDWAACEVLNRSEDAEWARR